MLYPMKTTQRNFALAIGVSEGYLSRILSGKVRISWQFAERVSEILPGTTQFWKNQTPKTLKRSIKAIHWTIPQSLAERHTRVESDTEKP